MLPFNPFVFNQSFEVLARTRGVRITNGPSYFGGFGKKLEDAVLGNSVEI